MATTRLYRDGALVKEGFDVADISDHIAEKGCVVWADFVSPTEHDLASIEEELGLHELAVEDAVHEHQRPKLDRYDTHLFLAAYAVSLNSETKELSKVEVKAFVTERAVITVHPESFDIATVTQRWDSNPDLAKNGAAFLLWGLLDVIVDGHFNTVQDLDAEIETYEDLLFDGKNHGLEIQRNSFELRKNLVMLRRAVLPMREVVNTLMRRDIELMRHDMAPYFQDVYDHVLRATEWT